MHIKTLILHNFRNYASLEIDFSKSVNILVGNNASGKSNLLESIYVLSVAKSHRTYLDEELVNHGQPGFYMKGKFEESLGEFLIEISNSVDGNKLVKIDGKNQQRISNLIGRVKVVIFSPESIDIVKGSPSDRRKFFDQIISQIGKSYLQNFQNYNSVLKQRNELLKKIRDEKASKELIEPWNIQIAETGTYIMSERKKMVKKIAELAKSKHHQLTQNREELDIHYNPSVDSTKNDNADTTDSDFKKFYLKKLDSVLERDINFGTTTVGPHRDEIDILIDGFEAKRFCSQGQQRTIALSMKLAEMESICNQLDEQPILLLDDVASELDARRANLVYELIDRLDIQTFITTTGLDNLKDYFVKWSDDYYEFVVENNSIKKTKG